MTRDIDQELKRPNIIWERAILPASVEARCSVCLRDNGKLKPTRVGLISDAGLLLRFRRNRGLANPAGLGDGFHIVPTLNEQPKHILSHDNEPVIRCPRGHRLLATRAAVEGAVWLHQKLDTDYVLLPPALGTDPKPDPRPAPGVLWNGSPIPDFTPTQVVLNFSIDWPAERRPNLSRWD